jgi:hypothetical protein
VPLVALAGARLFPTLAACGAGMALHLVLDAYGKRRFKRLRRALERRSAGYCEACRERQGHIALMEPYYVGSRGGKDTDPASWQLLCRPCNEARHWEAGAL